MPELSRDGREGDWGGGQRDGGAAAAGDAEGRGAVRAARCEGSAATGSVVAAKITKPPPYIIRGAGTVSGGVQSGPGGAEGTSASLSSRRLPMKTVFVDVDTQIDFAYPAGAL